MFWVAKTDLRHSGDWHPEIITSIRFRYARESQNPYSHKFHIPKQGCAPVHAEMIREQVGTISRRRGIWWFGVRQDRLRALQPYVCGGLRQNKFLMTHTIGVGGCASTRITQATLELQPTLGKGKDERDSSNEAFIEA